MVQQDWFTGVRDVTRNVAAFIPALVGAAILVLAGWLLGRLLAWAAPRAASGLIGRLARRPALRGALEVSETAAQAPGVIAGVVFWVVFVFFVAAAMETLGLPVVTASLSRIAYYLPNVLVALVLLFVGLIAGKFFGSAVSRAATGAGMAFGPTIGGTVRATVVLVAIVVAIEQVEIEADFLIVIIAVVIGAVVIGAVVIGAGLAFGLGARTAVSKIISSYYVAQVYRVGQWVRVGGVEGTDPMPGRRRVGRRLHSPVLDGESARRALIASGITGSPGAARAFQY